MLTLNKLNQISKETLVSATIVASDSNAEIFLIDSRYRMVNRGVGTLNVMVSPGLYTIKYKAGSVIVEDEKLLVPDQETQWIYGPELPLESAVPTFKTSKEHAEYARDASMMVHQSLGTGAQLFLFVHDLDILARTQPSTALTLLDDKGNEIIDFDEVAIQGKGSAKGTPWSTINIELDPGVYFLQNHTDEVGILMQSIVLSSGWQTQLFMTRRSIGSGKKGRRADMADASILMAPIGHGFEPSSESVRLTEIAKSALEQKRPAVGKELHDMLWAKFENPMLGLIGAHLLLKQKNYDKNLFRMVVDNLIGMLGNEHPDIKILLLQIHENAIQIPIPNIKYPPILQASWEKILQASIQNPEIISSDSVAAQVSMNTLNTGSWLVWKKPRKSLFKGEENIIHNISHDIAYELVSIPRKREHSKIIENLSEIKVSNSMMLTPGITNYQGNGYNIDFRKELLILQKSLDSKERKLLGKSYKLNIQEKALLEYIALLSSSSPLNEKKKETDVTEYHLKMLGNDAIVNALGIPAPLIDQLFQNIAKKIQRFGKSDALEIQKQVAKAMLNKGVTMENPKDERAVYDEVIQRFGKSDALEIKEIVAKAMFNKGFTLKNPKDERAAYNEVIKRFGKSDDIEIQKQVVKAMLNKGVTMENPKDQRSIYDAVIKRFGKSDVPEIQETVAKAMFNKGLTLKKSKDQRSIYDAVIKRFGKSDIPEIQETVAKAMHNKGVTMENPKDQRSIYDAVIKRFGKSDVLEIQETVSDAKFNKGLTLRNDKKKTYVGVDDEEIKPSMRE